MKFVVKCQDFDLWLDYLDIILFCTDINYNYDLAMLF